ncbi:MAG TPA: hypothetical protein PKZ42_10370 [Syntrophales bacterium]|nr:hypothetical protein [Syntrophales bacterium]
MGWLKEAGFLKDIYWVEGESRQRSILPDWASFLIWLGATMRRLQFEDMHIFCLALLPTRICGSALSAFGSLTNSLINSENELSWDLFLECEDGLKVYFIQPGKNGKKEQLEGELQCVNSRNGQKLRSIRIISRSKRFQDLIFQISESKFKDIKVAFHPHYPSRLLNHLHDLSNFFSRTLTNFNKNNLLMHDIESIVITNRAGWFRENSEILFGTVGADLSTFLSIKEILLTRFGRCHLCSPKSREIEILKSPLAILDGLDALRSRESIQARNFLILLDQEEYGEEAEDIFTQFSGYCLRKLSTDYGQLPTRCPDGIDVQFYAFR